MAARKRSAHDAKTRERIQTTMLINRLQSCAAGEVEMTSQQIKSAEILLRKAVPDLQSIEWDGRLDGDVNVNHTVDRKALEGIVKKLESTY